MPSFENLSNSLFEFEKYISFEPVKHTAFKLKNLLSFKI